MYRIFLGLFFSVLFFIACASRPQEMVNSPSPAITPQSASSPKSVPSPAPSPPSPQPMSQATPMPIPEPLPTLPSPSPSPPPVSESPFTYVVRSGDTLSAISQRFGIPVCALIARNVIQDPNLIYPDQILILENVPCLAPQPSAPQPESPPHEFVRGGTVLAVPEGVHTYFSPSGCSSNGYCPELPSWARLYYDSMLLEIVIIKQIGDLFVQHEFCHAHQHLLINGGVAAPIPTYDAWYTTAEGASFHKDFSGTPWLWGFLGHPSDSPVEDFAYTCAYWYKNPAMLLNLSPSRYEWAKQWLP